MPHTERQQGVGARDTDGPAPSRGTGAIVGAAVFSALTARLLVKVTALAPINLPVPAVLEPVTDWAHWWVPAVVGAAVLIVGWRRRS